MYTHTLANTHRSSDTHSKDHHLILPLWGSPWTTWMAVLVSVSISLVLLLLASAESPSVNSWVFVAVFVLSTSSMIWFPGWSVIIVTRIAIAVHTIIIPTISTRILTTIHTTRSSVGSSWVRGRHTATAGIATFGWASPLFTIAMCSVSTPCVLLTHYSCLLLWFHWRSWGGLCHFSLRECLLLRIWLWILQVYLDSLDLIPFFLTFPIQHLSFIFSYIKISYTLEGDV